MKYLLFVALLINLSCNKKNYEITYIDNKLEKIPYRQDFKFFKNFEYTIGSAGVIQDDSCEQKVKNHSQTIEEFTECTIKLSSKLKEEMLKLDTPPQLVERVEIIKPVLFSEKMLTNQIKLQLITFSSRIRDCSLCNKSKSTYLLFEINDSLTAIVIGNQTTFMLHQFIEYLGEKTFMVKRYGGDEASIEYELSEIVVFKINNLGKIDILNMEEAQKVLMGKYDLIDYWDYVNQNLPQKKNN